MGIGWAQGGLGVEGRSRKWSNKDKLDLSIQSNRQRPKAGGMMKAGAGGQVPDWTRWGKTRCMAT